MPAAGRCVREDQQHAVTGMFDFSTAESLGGGADKDVVRANQLQAFTESEAGLRQQLDHVRRSEAELRRLLDQTRSALDESEASLEAIHQTRAWRMITRWWSIKRRLTRH